MLILRRETNVQDKNTIKIYDAMGQQWIATVKVLESDNGSASLGCIGPNSTKFLRGEVKEVEGKEGNYSSALNRVVAA